MSDQSVSTAEIPFPSSKGRILIIDDEADIRESLETLLSMEGYVVDMAPNATEGWRVLQQSNYDLVLLDLMMPDRSGIDLLGDIRRKDNETPVIMITAYGSVEVAVKAFEAGASPSLVARGDERDVRRARLREPEYSGEIGAVVDAAIDAHDDAVTLVGLLFVVCVGCGSRRDGMGQGPVAAQKGAEAARENQAATVRPAARARIRRHRWRAEKP